MNNEKYFCLYCDKEFTTYEGMSDCIDKHIDNMNTKGKHHIKRKKKAINKFIENEVTTNNKNKLEQLELFKQ